MEEDDRGGEVDIELRNDFLLPEFQRRGIGSRLVTDVHGLARSKGKGVRLTVIRCNPAKKLYDRLGFAVTLPMNLSS